MVDSTTGNVAISLILNAWALIGIAGAGAVVVVVCLILVLVCVLWCRHKWLGLVKDKTDFTLPVTQIDENTANYIIEQIEVATSKMQANPMRQPKQHPGRLSPPVGADRSCSVDFFEQSNPSFGEHDALRAHAEQQAAVIPNEGTLDHVETARTMHAEVERQLSNEMSDRHLSVLARLESRKKQVARVRLSVKRLQGVDDDDNFSDHSGVDDDSKSEGFSDHSVLTSDDDFKSEAVVEQGVERRKPKRRLSTGGNDADVTDDAMNLLRGVFG